MLFLRINMLISFYLYDLQNFYAVKDIQFYYKALSKINICCEDVDPKPKKYLDSIIKHELIDAVTTILK